MMDTFLPKGILFVLLLLALGRCTSPEHSLHSPPRVAYLTTATSARSPHQETEAALRTTLADDSLSISTFVLPSAAAQDSGAVQNGWEPVQAFSPDVLVAGDLASLQAVLDQHVALGSKPVVYCGAYAWTPPPNAPPVVALSSPSALPSMVDTLRLTDQPLRSVLLLLPATEKAAQPALDSLCRRTGLRPMFAWVNDFAEWTAQYTSGNENFDLLYLASATDLPGWNDTLAYDVARQYIRRPVLTSAPDMVPYAVWGITQDNRTRGQWAAAVVQRLLDGAQPGPLEVPYQPATQSILNPELAGQIDLTFSEALVAQSRLVTPTE